MKVVTSFSPEGYDLYGKRFLESYIKFMDVPLWVYVEGTEADVLSPLITYKDLWKAEGLVDFLSGCSQFPVTQGNLWGEGKRNYRFDVFKFSRKSFAQIDAAATNDDYLLWLDADIELTGEIPIEPTDAFVSYLGRPEWHSCTSYVLYNLRHPGAGEFFKRLWLLYVTGTVFCLPEWHDAFIFDWLLEQTKLPAVNLAHGRELKGPANVFDEVFGKYATHRKGNLKVANQS